MKNLRIVSFGVVLFCFVISLKGQTEKGKVLIGGETKLNFTSLNSKWKSDVSSGDNGKSTNLEFGPQIGFFVIDGLVLGAELPIKYSSETDENDNKNSSTSLAFAPFVRYYFGTSNIKPYLQGEVGFGNLKMKYGPTMSAKMFLYQIGAGLGIFLNEKVSLDIGLGYESVSIKPKENNNTNFRTIGHGFGLGIGIVVVL